MTQEEIKKIIEKVKTKGLVINRVPKNTKMEFIDFADQEFESDYGMTLKYIWDNFKLWKIFFENMDMKLDKIIDLANNQNNQKPEEKQIRMLSGKKIKYKEVKNE